MDQHWQKRVDTSPGTGHCRHCQWWQWCSVFRSAEWRGVAQLSLRVLSPWPPHPATSHRTLRMWHSPPRPSSSGCHQHRYAEWTSITESIWPSSNCFIQFYIIWNIGFTVNRNYYLVDSNTKQSQLSISRLSSSSVVCGARLVQWGSWGEGGSRPQNIYIVNITIAITDRHQIRVIVDQWCPAIFTQQDMPPAELGWLTLVWFSVVFTATNFWRTRTM